MRDQIVVIGAGIGGLAASITLASVGIAATLLERASAPGGKMRQVAIEGRSLDGGPTVLTMASVFEDLFAQAGESLADHLTLQRARVLARHAWSETERLDLHAETAASADAIGRFAGATEARGFLAFTERAARIWRTLEPPFIRSQRPSVAGLTARAGPVAMARISPFTTLAAALGRHFADPRLRQLFGRYATYCGTSPYEAPATLMLVAHLESQGVWRVQGGMHALARALDALAVRVGVTARYGAEVARILVEGGRVRGVALSSGEHLAAGAVICAADVNAIVSGLFGDLPRAARPLSPRARSLSALTWATLDAPEYPLLHHNVFFSRDYGAEFRALGESRLPEAPTVYVCAQDRGDDERAPAPERLLCLVNAPAVGDAGHPTPTEIDRCRERTLTELRRCGLKLALDPSRTETTSPVDWNRLFPATGGALYGASARGWAASFRRPGARTPLSGLYLAGGSTHPGPGVPMAALSGRLAASALIEDLASTARSRRTAIYGGISTRSARTAHTA